MISLVIILGLLLLNYLLPEIFELKDMYTYVQTYCLVKRFWLAKCGEVGYLFGKIQCIQPFWLIEYIDYKPKVVATISEMQRWVEYKENDQDHIDGITQNQV